jgi:hypothetical protein
MVNKKLSKASPPNLNLQNLPRLMNAGAKILKVGCSKSIFFVLETHFEFLSEKLSHFEFSDYKVAG